MHRTHHDGIKSHTVGEVTSALIVVCEVSAAFLAIRATVTAVRRTARGSTTSASMSATTVVPTYRLAITAAVTTGTMTVAIIAEINGVVPTGTATAAYETAAVLTVVFTTG